jgi:hypothetical protein
VTHQFTSETENVEFNEVTTNYMAAINSLNRLICSKSINIKQYLSTNHFLVNNRHCVIKYSQTTQLYITKVFENNSVVMIT